MSTAIRHDEILRRLGQFGRIRVAEISNTLHVSEETVRRDFAALEARGLLRRVHGGAVPFALDRERPVEERARVRAKEKALLGEAAAQLVKDGMSVFIDTGSTPTACARYLVGRANLTVMTNSLDIARELGASAGIKVRLTPGALRPKDNAIVGVETCSFVEGHAFDMALVGIGACDLSLGWMDYEEDESVLRRILVSRVRDLVMLADHTKFGKRAAVRTFPLDQHLIVATNKQPPESFTRAFRQSGIDVVTPS